MNQYKEVICMEKSLIGLVLIALIAGLGGGYGLGYLIYQPQVQNLQTDLNNLNDGLQGMEQNLQTTQIILDHRLEAIENKTWHFVTKITLWKEDDVSPIFFIEGEKWRIKWGEREGITVYYGFSLQVFKENGEIIEMFTSFDYINKQIYSGVHYIPDGEGNYHIKVDYFGNPEAILSYTIESYH